MPLLVSSANVTDPKPTASPSSPSSPSNTSGGLFALRWPLFNGATGIKGSLAADPIPATASLPAWLMDALLRGVLADQLTVDMGSWSNGKRVKAVQAWPGGGLMGPFPPAP